MSVKFEGEPPFYLGVAETAAAQVLNTNVIIRRLKSAIRPLGLDHPFVAVTEYDVKERFFRALCHDGVRVTPVVVVRYSTPRF